MDRRKAIKRIGASFGAITISSGVISLVQSCNSPTNNKELSFFSKNEINFLDRILEIIIPETDSPGANSLNLSKFVDAYIAKNIRTEDQKYLNSIIKNVELAKTYIYEIAGMNNLSCIKSFTNFVAIDCGKSNEYAKKVMENLINLGIFLRMPSVAPLNRCIRLTVGSDLDLDRFASSLKLSL